MQEDKTINSDSTLAEDSPYLFIPTMIDGAQKTRMSQVQVAAAFGTAVYFVIGLAFVVWYGTQAMLPGFKRTVFLFIGLNTLFLTALKLVRVFVIQEKKLKADFEAGLHSAVTTPKPFYEVTDILADGRILYADGTEAYMICLQRDYVYARDPSFQKQHYALFTQVLSDLLGQGYNLLYYSYETGDTNTGPSQGMRRDMLPYAGTTLYTVGSTILNHISSVVDGVRTEHEILLVKSDYDIPMLRGLEDSVKRAVNDLGQSLYGKVHVCTEEEIWRFNNEYFELDDINISELKVKHSIRNNAKIFLSTERETVSTGVSYDDIEIDLYDHELDNMYSDLFNKETESNVVTPTEPKGIIPDSVVGLHRRTQNNSEKTRL